ncbi:DUF4270 family protein [Bacteroidales bacterium OttesenSCG-928-M06]|nr:DUF4270 family protein [Bacteroidales bacterium OttesenSCG-928-M06]
MKTKVIAFCLFLGLFYLSGCEDTIDSLGAGIQPDGNKIEIYDLSLNLTGETIKLDSIYAKSINGLLGNVNHPAYGSVQGGYACQFYPSAEFVLDSMLKSEIDSIQLKIMYFNYLGDSLAPMEVSVFPLNKALEENYYTNVDLTQYADMQSILGKRAYTARNLNITDSINEADYEDQKYKVLSVTLPKELGQSFFDEYKKEGDGVFVSQEAFTKYFPGVYINPTFGSGCLLDVEKTAIYIYYERKWQYYNSTSEKDTIVEGTAIATLNVTKIVIPNSVEEIGYHAFSRCSSLASVTISNKVTNIENFTFSDCTSLRSVIIPEGVTRIGVGVFEECTSLVSVVIPSSVTEINHYAFENCTSLKHMQVSWNTPLDIDSYTVFYNTPLQGCTLYVPAGTKAFYEKAGGWGDFGTIIEGTITSIDTPKENSNIYISGNTLYVNTPVAETISVYSIKGELLYTFAKAAGETSFPLGHDSNEILIIRDSAGKTKKVIQ